MLRTPLPLVPAFKVLDEMSIKYLLETNEISNMVDNNIAYIAKLSKEENYSDIITMTGVIDLTIVYDICLDLLDKTIEPDNVFLFSKERDDIGFELFKIVTRHVTHKNSIAIKTDFCDIVNALFYKVIKQYNYNMDMDKFAGYLTTKAFLIFSSMVLESDDSYLYPKCVVWDKDGKVFENNRHVLITL